MNEKSAYEKMFEDGSAFEKIEIDQPSPNNPNGGMGRYDTENNNLFEQHMDRSMDDHIEKAKRLKESKMGGVVEQTNTQPEPYIPTPQMQKNESKKMKELERRISMLEQALQLVMETQTKFLKENK